MTLCVGAICRESLSEPRIVLGFDERIENEWIGAEIEHKFRWLSDDNLWCSAFAGPMARVNDLVATYQRALAGKSLSEASVYDELRGPAEAQKAAIVEAFVRMRLGISYEEFLNTKWPEETVNRILQDIENQRLEAQLLIAGFIGSEPYLFTVNEGGNERLERHNQFAAIGSGAVLASSMLFHRRHHEWRRFDHALYAVYEAQRFGQSAPGVGSTNVHLVVLRPDQRGKKMPMFVRKAGLSKLDQLFSAYAPKDIPSANDLGFDSTHFMEARTDVGDEVLN